MEKVNIFDIVKPCDNDIIGSMDKEYREDYLKYLNQYILGLRESLDLSNNITFGLEIEVENVRQIFLKKLKYENFFKDWDIDSDITLTNGMELISPKLVDDVDNWGDLLNFSNKLSEFSVIDVNCGGHIHIGVQVLGTDIKNYYNLLKLWAAYENVIFRFGYGEFIFGRNNMYSQCFPIFDKVYAMISNSLEYRFIPSNDALNFNLVEKEIYKYDRILEGRTFEIRNPNGSLNAVIWQNNVNFFTKLLIYASKDGFNYEVVDRRLELLKDKLVNSVVPKLQYYNNIDIEAAIELADLIFDKNIDKVYFLRQYIKNYEVGNVVLQKGKKFTKNPNY